MTEVAISINYRNSIPIYILLVQIAESLTNYKKAL